ncbi:MAG: hypothetical protein JNM75_09760 [Rhodospirillales bacterium]|nr:hypothetical protein [Rhodospirillales bacterium]
MRHVTDKGLALIKQLRRLQPIDLQRSWRLIDHRYGHVLTEGEREQFAVGIGEEEAEDLLRGEAGTPSAPWTFPKSSNHPSRS